MSDRTTQQVIEGLERPFPPEALRTRPGAGGMPLPYIDWTMAVRRLNEELGADNWDFTVSDLQFFGDQGQGYAICRGSMTVRFPDGTTATKGNFGGNGYGQGGRGMSPDDAAKGAGSDALKKCASLFGVALDLAEKDAPSGGGYSGGGYQTNGYQGNQRPSAPPQQQSFTQGQGQQGSFEDDPLYCEECGEPLTETRFKDGTNWSPSQLAVFGRRKHSRILCMTHYREANQAKRRAEEALQQVPF